MMGKELAIFLPFVLLLARMSGFMATLPILSSASAPMRVRAGMALVLTVFVVAVVPNPSVDADVNWVQLVLFVAYELICGLALGLAANLVYLSIQQGARMAARQMGFAMASLVDPNSGEESLLISIIFEMAFAVFFLVCGGHHLLVRIIVGSYKAFPVAAVPDVASLAEGIVRAGSAMLLFALQMAAPLLAAFLILAVVLGILARILPQMNILMDSFSLRVGVGFFMAAALMPTIKTTATELARWMSRLLIT